jgi:hypothetical protein
MAVDPNCPACRGETMMGRSMQHAHAKTDLTMSEFKSGTLHSGSKTGPVVTNRKQAVAIALSQQQRANRGKA